MNVFLRGGGALINRGSELSDHGIPLQGMYAASKHAVKGFTDSLRLEVQESRAPVSVTLIQPAAIDTPYTEHQDAAPALLEALQSESAVREAFRVLGREQQRCVALAFLEGLSHPEIAERLGMPLGTVKNLLFRARKRLMELAQPEEVQAA